MSILYIHSHFVGQFSNVMSAVNGHYNQYVICCEMPPIAHGSNIIKIGAFNDTNPFENGLNASKALFSLKSQGVYPKIIFIHVGDGLGLMAGDVFPESTIIGYTEWFFKEKTISNVMKNAIMRKELDKCSICISPTKNQKKQFSPDIQKKILVMHEGINPIFQYAVPKELRMELSNPPRYTITYVTRGFEPMRCFMEFIYGINILLKFRQDIDVKIVGIDKVFYDDSTTSYKTLALEALGDNIQYVEFMGQLSLDKIRDLFNISDIHVYYTLDFVLSWSFIEAMMVGCIIIGSSSAPVQEFLTEGYNGFLVNPSDFYTFRDKVNMILASSDNAKSIIRRNANTSVRHLTKQNCGANWKSLIDSLM